MTTIQNDDDLIIIEEDNDNLINLDTPKTEELISFGDDKNELLDFHLDSDTNESNSTSPFIFVPWIIISNLFQFKPLIYILNPTVLS